MQTLIEARELSVHFTRSGSGGKSTVRAMDALSFTLSGSESLGVIGESGCGKTTLARTVVGLQPPTSGRLQICGKDAYAGKKYLLRKSAETAMIFQDADSSLDPRMTVKQLLEEPMRIHRWSKEAIAERSEELLRLVNLGQELMGRYPHEISGGQRQRLGMARALALRPSILVADEPAASLDSSIQAQLLHFLDELRREKGLGLLYISHNLRIVRRMTGSLIVMYLGQIVESGGTEEIFESPLHPYTQMLFSAILKVGDDRYGKRDVFGEIPDANHIPEGCRFHERCRKCTELCKKEEPAMREVSPGRFVKCHHLN